MPTLKKLICAALSALLLASCSTTVLEPKIDPKPLSGFDLVDPALIDGTAYEKDYQACTALANQDNPEFKRAVAGAVGSIAGPASMGLLSGGNGNKFADRVTVLKNCLTGRGYRVLR